MTEKITITEKEIIQGLESIISNLANARNTLKTSEKDIENSIGLLKAGMKSKNWSEIVKILFYKIGNTSFYALYLKDYLKENGVFFEYNVKKDKVFYFGKIEEVKQTYTEWKEERKKERQKEEEKLTKKEKVYKSFSKIAKLDKESLTILSELVKERLKKAV